MASLTPPLALALLVVPVAAAAQNEDFRWHGGIDATQAVLTHSKPSATDFAISFACDRNDKRIVVRLPFAPVFTPPDHRAAIDLLVPEDEGIGTLRSFPLEGEQRQGFSDPFAAISLPDALMLEAEVFYEVFQRIAEAAGEMEILVEDGSTAVPLDGIAAPAAAILAACAPDARPAPKADLGWFGLGGEDWARVIYGSREDWKLEVYCSADGTDAFFFFPDARGPEGEVQLIITNHAQAFMGEWAPWGVLHDDQFSDDGRQVLTAERGFAERFGSDFTESETLRIRAGDTISETLPLAGIGEAASLVRAACG